MSKDPAKPVTVSQLTASIKALLKGAVGVVSVRGEISNWRPAASGHIYFSLKDPEAMIGAALFQGVAARLPRGQFRDGTEVVCRGRIDVYAPRGTYQVIVEHMEPVGAGSLQAAFEALKRKLHAEGLFDPSRKRPIPAMPSRIVVITSPTGAAIRDVLSVLKRRNAGMKVLLVPALVQGAEAPAELLRALETVNEFDLGDVILLTRGGGSLEDLWAFNDERLARAIAASRIPVVSAVGHEIDFTISDFVADLRAPTPSAAAEILVKESREILERLRETELRLERCLRNLLRQLRLELRGVSGRLKSPKDRLNELRLRIDDWSERLLQASRRDLAHRRQRLDRQLASLRALSPLQVLDRGYSLVFTRDGKIVKTSGGVKKGQEIEVRVSDGAFHAEVT
ncbi:MAG: exodeoxyribonuclease VII large subunit [Bdellovibrionales bacterium]|nr:exodeoxyribonuclease VII large subunit [Bdellovibrionales bacterium]